jgi:hypothetical protein
MHLCLGYGWWHLSSGQGQVEWEQVSGAVCAWALARSAAVGSLLVFSPCVVPPESLFVCPSGLLGSGMKPCPFDLM